MRSKYLTRGAHMQPKATGELQLRKRKRQDDNFQLANSWEKYREVRGDEPVSCAIVNCSISLLRLALNSGFLPTSVNREGQTSLHTAIDLIIHGSWDKLPVAVEMIELLLKSGADPNCENIREGKTALYRIVSHRNHVQDLYVHEIVDKLMKILLSYGADISPRIGDPFSIALAGNNADAVRQLLDHGYRWNDCRIKQLPAPLDWISTRSKRNLFELLVTFGIFDLEAKDLNGCTALLRAVQSQSLDLLDEVGFLLELGANIEAVDSKGRSALLIASGRGTEIDSFTYARLLRLLVSRGANIVGDFQRLKGLSFQNVLLYGNWNTIWMFYSKLRIRGLRDDMTDLLPFHTAVSNPDLLVLSSLLFWNKLWSLEQKNRFGNTPLHESVIHHDNFADRVKILLEHGSDVDSVNKYGWTPLHCACSGSLYECTKVLLSYGADVNAKTLDGERAFEIAMSRKDRSICELLVSHIALLESEDPRLVDSQNYRRIRDDPEMNNFYRRCHAEIQVSRELFVSKSITYHHLLTLRDPSQHVSNQAIIDALLTRGWQNEFSIYQGHLIKCLLKAQESVK